MKKSNKIYKDYYDNNINKEYDRKEQKETKHELLSKKYSKLLSSYNKLKETYDNTTQSLLELYNKN